MTMINVYLLSLLWKVRKLLQQVFIYRSNKTACRYDNNFNFHCPVFLVSLCVRSRSCLTERKCCASISYVYICTFKQKFKFRRYKLELRNFFRSLPCRDWTEPTWRETNRINKGIFEQEKTWLYSTLCFGWRMMDEDATKARRRWLLLF